MKARIFLMLLLAATCMAGQAQKKKGGKAKKADINVLAAVEADSLKPVDARIYSYAQGVLFGESLREYIVKQLGIDSTYIPTVVEYFTNPMTEEEAKLQRAKTAGQQISEQNRKSILPMINFQATGMRDSNFADETEYCRALAQQVMRKPTDISVDSAKALVNQQNAYFNAKYKAKNEAYLVENAKTPGVKTTESGIQYVILQEGNGPKPAADAKVKCHYEGKLIDGTVFDSSYERGEPAVFPLKGVIKGWQEILQMMPEGSKWRVTIPQELAYGGRGGGSQIPPYSTLTFDILLIKADAK